MVRRRSADRRVHRAAEPVRRSTRRAVADPRSPALTAGAVLGLQRVAGNRAVEAAIVQRELDKAGRKQRGKVQHALSEDSPPKAVSYDDVKQWADWYFAGVQYQDNKTNGWHSNRKELLPGTATSDGEPTRYVEFRRPGAVGEKDKTKLERCIFDLFTSKCYPNAHYDEGYVEISNMPSSITKSMGAVAFVATGMKQLVDAQEVDISQGNPLEKKTRLLAKLHEKWQARQTTEDNDGGGDD